MQFSTLVGDVFSLCFVGVESCIFIAVTMLMYEYTSLFVFFLNKFSSVLAKCVVPIYCNVILWFAFDIVSILVSVVFSQNLLMQNGWKTLS